MLNPFSEPQAQDLLKLDLGALDQIAQFFSNVSTKAGDSADGLRTAQTGVTWEGSAADQFTSSISPLPPMLDQFQTGYSHAAGGLNAYAGEVGGLQSKFVALKASYDLLTPQLTSANAAASAATTKLSGLVNTPHNGSQSVAKVIDDASDAATQAGHQAQHLQTELSGVTTRAQQVLDEFNTLLQSTVRHIANGTSAAPQPPHHSFLGGLWDDIKGAGKWVGGVFVGMGKSIVDLPAATVELAEHPSAAHLQRFLQDAVTTATAVAMVAAPFAAPELAEGLAAEGGAEGATDAAGEGAADEVASEGGDQAAEQQTLKQWARDQFHQSDSARTALDRASTVSKQGTKVLAVDEELDGNGKEGVETALLYRLQPGDKIADKLFGDGEKGATAAEGEGDAETGDGPTSEATAAAQQQLDEQAVDALVKEGVSRETAEQAVYGDKGAPADPETATPTSGNQPASSGSDDDATGGDGQQMQKVAEGTNSQKAEENGQSEADGKGEAHAVTSQVADSGIEKAVHQVTGVKDGDSTKQPAGATH